MYRLRLVHLGSDREPRQFEAEIENCEFKVTRYGQQRPGIYIGITIDSPYRRAYGRNHKYHDPSIEINSTSSHEKSSVTNLEAANLGYLIGYVLRDGCRAKVAVYNLDLTKIICFLPMKIRATNGIKCVLGTPFPRGVTYNYKWSKRNQEIAEHLLLILGIVTNLDDFWKNED